MNSYYYTPYYPGSYGYGYPWNRWNGASASRFHAENILVLSFNENDTLEWSNVINKAQFDDESDGLISYGLLNTGGELHFLFNLYERRTLLLNDQMIAPSGKVTRYPTMKNLGRDVEFMPKYGKQIGSRSMVIPCQYRNYLIFAKIDF